jgi:hypothetical protein
MHAMVSQVYISGYSAKKTWYGVQKGTTNKNVDSQAV